MRVREKRCTCREGEKRNQKCRGKDKRREVKEVGWWDIRLYRLITDLCLHLVLILILTLEGGLCQPYL